MQAGHAANSKNSDKDKAKDTICAGSYEVPFTKQKITLYLDSFSITDEAGQTKTQLAVEGQSLNFLGKKPNESFDISVKEIKRKRS